MRDIHDFHKAFYSIPEKGKQDSFILKFCRAELPNPKRKKKDSIKGKSTTFEYTIVNQAWVNIHVSKHIFESFEYH